jgi:medium-chain acyl-[acyl-carrier-protein] hydrolase
MNCFPIRSYELDANGRLAVSALLNLMQEAANLNAGRLGLSMDDLAELGLGWVLNRLKINVSRWPGANETLHIDTYPTRMDRFAISRDFQLTDASGNAIGHATSTWLTFDLNTRQLASLPDYIRQIKLDPNRVMAEKLPNKVVVEGEVIHSDEFRIRWHDLDANQHTNNAVYAQMLIDALPPAQYGYHLAELDLFFKAETFPGDAIRADTIGQPKPGQLAHRLIRPAIRPADDKEVMVARSLWQ